MLLSEYLCQNTVKGWHLLGLAILVIRIAVPIILICTALVPIYNEIIKGNSEEAIKGLKNMGKKLIAGIVVFLIPTIIEAAVRYISGSDFEAEDMAICVSCFNSPKGRLCQQAIIDFNELEQKEIEEMKKKKPDDSSIEGGSLDTEDLTKDTTSSTDYGTRSFNLEHAINVHDNIHRGENSDLPWHNSKLGYCGGSIGAYTEAVNILNEKDYRIYEVYDVLVKAHPELITSDKEPYLCTDVNNYYNVEVTEIESTVSAMREALNKGCLVQKIVHSDKWRDDKGNLLSWPGYHWGLIFYYDGTYYHMKAAGNIDQSNAIYTEAQLEEWLDMYSWQPVMYCKK